MNAMRKTLLLFDRACKDCVVCDTPATNAMIPQDLIHVPDKA